MFISAIVSLLTTTLTVYLLCKHKKIRALIISLVLHQVKEVGAVPQENNSECTTLAYIGNNSNNVKFNNSPILTL